MPNRPTNVAAALVGGVLCLSAAPAIAAHASLAPASLAPASLTPASLAPPPGSEDPAFFRDGLRVLIASARDQVFPSLVNISVITVNYYGGKETKGGGTGSGTIISKEGHVVTNAHVTSSGKRFKVTLADRQEVSAELVGEDAATDLAVLKINLSELKGDNPLPVASFGDSDELQMGDYVIAMGSPYSLSRSITLGIVSNTERVFAGSRRGADEIEAIDMIDGRATGTFTRWIQHDALINPGNSGGPLVNLRGQIVGVNTRGGAGMGFASPSNMVRGIVDKLLAHGEVPRSQVGVALKHIDRSGLKEGVLITSVDAKGPAAKAGLKAGDVLVRIEGQPVTARFAEEIPPLLRRFAEAPIGGTINLTVARDGKTIDAQVVTERMLKDKGDEAVLRGWGVSVEDVTERYFREARLESRDGVLVTGVRSGSPAGLSEPALGPGDVIRAVGGQPVKDLSDLAERYRVIMAQEPIPEFLLVEFARDSKTYVTVIKPRPPKREDPAPEVPKAWIGIDTQVVLKDLARQLGGEANVGFRVTRVYPKTLAAESELKVGDIIVALNGDKMVPRGLQESGQLTRAIQKLKLEEGKATLRVMRNGEPREVTVGLERTKTGPAEARKDDNKDFELVVRELTFFDRDDNRWDDTVKGVMVSGADPAGWAGQGGLYGGDLIQRIDSDEITDIETYRAAMAKVTKAQPERVTFVVLRGTRTYFKFVEPDWKPLVDKKKAEQVQAEKQTPAAPAADNK